MRDHQRHARPYRVIVNNIIIMKKSVKGRSERVNHSIKALVFKRPASYYINAHCFIFIMSFFSSAVINRHVNSEFGKPCGKLTDHHFNSAGAARKILMTDHCNFHSLSLNRSRDFMIYLFYFITNAPSSQSCLYTICSPLRNCILYIFTCHRKGSTLYRAIL